MRTEITFRFFLLSVLLSVCCLHLQGQDYLSSDSTKQAYFYPGVSAVVLQKDAMEITFRNSLTTFWRAFHEYNPALRTTQVFDRQRYSAFEHSLQISRGFSRSQRWDLGVEAKFAHTRQDRRAGSSPFLVLGSDTTGGESHHGMSYIGLRARAMPFARVPELTLQGAFFFPTGKDFVKRRDLNAVRKQMNLGATFFKKPFYHTYYFLLAEWRTFFYDIEQTSTTHAPAIGAYLVREMADERIFAMGGLTYSPTYEQSYKGAPIRKSSQFLLGFLGVQYQPSRLLGIYVNTQIPFVVDSGSNYEEWVKKSFGSWSLGVRLLL